MQDNKRIIWADIAKAIAITAMVAGHTYPPAGNVCKMIYLFHVPLFFILAGYFFNFEKYKDNFKKLLVSSAKRLLLPCLIAIIAFYDIQYLASKNILTFIYGIGKPIFSIQPIGYSMWFLYCLFVVRILFWVYLKFIEKFKIPTAISFIISFCIAFLGVEIGKVIKLPWSIDIALVAIYLSYVGYLLKKSNFFNWNKYIHILLSIVFIILGYIDYKYFGLSMNERYYSNPLMSLNGAIAISILIFYFANIMEKLNDKIFIHNINNICGYIGQNTIIIMLVHMFAHSSISYGGCVCFRLFVSILIIEILSRIPIINDIMCAKSYAIPKISSLAYKKTDKTGITS